MRARSETDDLVTWAPQGDLTLPFAAEQRGELLEMMASASRVEIDLQAIDEIDLSGVQILLAARASAAAQGKHLALTRAPAETFAAMLERGGLLEGDDLRAFWRLGEVS